MALWIYKQGLERELSPEEDLQFIKEYVYHYDRPKF